jgi:hypothetical protein
MPGREGRVGYGRLTRLVGGCLDWVHCRMAFLFEIWDPTLEAVFDEDVR